MYNYCEHIQTAADCRRHKIWTPNCLDEAGQKVFVQARFNSHRRCHVTTVIWPVRTFYYLFTFPFHVLFSADRIASERAGNRKCFPCVREYSQWTKTLTTSTIHKPSLLNGHFVWKISSWKTDIYIQLTSCSTWTTKIKCTVKLINVNAACCLRVSSHIRFASVRRMCERPTAVLIYSPFSRLVWYDKWLRISSGSVRATAPRGIVRRHSRRNIAQRRIRCERNLRIIQMHRTLFVNG